MGALRMYSHRGDLKGLLGAGTALVKRGLGIGAAVLPGAGIINAVGGAVLGTVASKAVGTGYAIGKQLTSPVDRFLAGPQRKKYRRMNVANTRALNRAVRRIQGAEKLFRKVLSVQGKQHSGIKPKKRR